MVAFEHFPPCSVTRNKYLSWYLALCSQNSQCEYTEKHHIVPRSFGGTDHEHNLVRLSARAHYLAHVMLIRCSIAGFKKKAALAAHYMLSGCAKHRRKNLSSSRLYKYVREEFAQAQRDKIVTVETRVKIGNVHRGKTISPVAKQKMGETLKKKHSFFMLDGDVYSEHDDFYRFCDEHKIGRSQVQAGLRHNKIHIILAGKHRSKCFSWENVGIERCKAARDDALRASFELRSAKVSAAWKNTRSK